MTIFAEMADLLPGFKHLMDTAGQRGLDELCARFEGFYRYARIFENITSGSFSLVEKEQRYPGKLCVVGCKRHNV